MTLYDQKLNNNMYAFCSIVTMIAMVVGVTLNMSFVSQSTELNTDLAAPREQLNNCTPREAPSSISEDVLNNSRWTIDEKTSFLQDLRIKLLMRQLKNESVTTVKSHDFSSIDDDVGDWLWSREKKRRALRVEQLNEVRRKWKMYPVKGLKPYVSPVGYLKLYHNATYRKEEQDRCAKMKWGEHVRCFQDLDNQFELELKLHRLDMQSIRIQAKFQDDIIRRRVRYLENEKDFDIDVWNYLNASLQLMMTINL